jgi:hypothetical protein
VAQLHVGVSIDTVLLPAAAHAQALVSVHGLS